MKTYAKPCDGTSLLWDNLEAQRRYADGIKSCISNFLKGHAIDQDYLIVANGKVVSPSYSYAFRL